MDFCLGEEDSRWAFRSIPAMVGEFILGGGFGIFGGGFCTREEVVGYADPWFVNLVSCIVSRAYGWL